MGREAVGDLCIDAHQRCRHMNQFPGIVELALGIVMIGHIDRLAGLAAGLHASRIGAMGGNDLAIVQADIGQKAFVAPDQRASDQRRPGNDTALVDFLDAPTLPLCVVKPIFRAFHRKAGSGYPLWNKTVRCRSPGIPFEWLSSALRSAGSGTKREMYGTGWGEQDKCGSRPQKTDNGRHLLP